jgi:soluble lytic murein transglycosylase
VPRLASIFLIAIAFAVTAAAQGDTDHRLIRSQVDEGNFAAAVEALQKLRDRDRTFFEANNYDYLLARALDKTGRTAEAAGAYLAVSKRNSILKEYALWHLAAIARGSGNLLLERTYLQEIVAFSPDSLLATSAKQRTIRSFSESGNYDQVVKLLAAPEQPAVAQTAAAIQSQRQGMVLLADAYLRSGDAAKARETFTKLITGLTNPAQPDDFALAAVRGLDHLDKQTATRLSDYDELQRATIYQFNRDFAGSRPHYAAILANYPTSGLAPDAVYQTGRGYALDGQFTDALVWYERVLEQYPEHPAAKDALLQAASVYARLGKRREAVARYQQFIAKYPDDERLDRAHLNIVDVYRDAREESEALKWAADTQAKFKGKQAEALALFAQARTHIALNDWTAALTDLDALAALPDIGGPATPGATTRSEIAFLKAYTLEQLQRIPEAVDAYLAVPDGRNEYYGWRANERLAALAQNEKSKPAVEAKLASLLAAKSSSDADTQRKTLQSAIRLTADPQQRKNLVEELRKIYAQIPAYKSNFSFRFLELGRRQPRTKAETLQNTHQQIADELIFLGLDDEAARELEAARQPTSTGMKTDFDYTLAVLYKRGDRADRAASFVEPLWRMPADYQIELIPQNVLELLYPTPYREALIKSGPPRGVDPRFVLSIMRQESRFRADVKSAAAARGLMQFISSTADRIAAELNRNGFRQDDLYDPPTAVLFGSQYIADIFKQFPEQPSAVAASYNGGEDNVARWLARSRTTDPDRYTAEVVFAQSKDYVFKVISNYRMYKLIYDENLKPMPR